MVDQRQHDSPADKSASSDREERISDFEILAGAGSEEIASASAEVHQAIGMVSVQLGGSIADASAALIARAVAERRPLDAMADDVIDHRTAFPALD